MTTVPRCRLAPLPTPLLRAPALGAALGVSNLWLKRDDLIAFAFGGNKVRGLEFMLADARESRPRHGGRGGMGRPRCGGRVLGF